MNIRLSLDETNEKGKEINMEKNIPDVTRQNENAQAEQIAKMQVENIIQTGSVITRGEDFRIFVMSVIGQIEGHYLSPHDTKTTKYEHILPMLASIEENPLVDGLLLLLNTMGGDVEAGLAISEMIAGMKKPTVSLVLGGSHSIGVPLAVAADISMIVPSATMTLHPVRTSGLVIGVPQSFAYFSKMQERITDFICAHSKIKKDVLCSYIMRTGDIATDMGAIIDGSEAVEIGLIDKIGGLSDALAELKRLIDKKTQ